MTKKQLLKSFKEELEALEHSHYTINYYISIISQFLDLVGVKKSYDRKDILKFRQALSPLSVSSKRAYTRVLRTFLVNHLSNEWPFKKGEMTVSSIIGGEALSEEEMNKLLEYSKNNRNLEVYAILQLLAETGMRPGEIGRLSKKDYNSPYITIHMLKKKREETRTVRLSDEAVRAVNIYTKSRKDGNESLFLSPGTRKRIDGAGVGRMFHGIAEACHIYRKGLGPHAVRRGWATWAAEKGASIYDLQLAGGWDDISMPGHYVRVRPQEAAERIRKLNPFVRD